MIVVAVVAAGAAVVAAAGGQCENTFCPLVVNFGMLDGIHGGAVLRVIAQ